MSFKRTRKYLYEIKDPDENLIKNLKSVDCKYHIFAPVKIEEPEEIKIMGFIYFKNTKTYNAAEHALGNSKCKIMPTVENTTYIQNKYKSFPQFWESGSLPKQGKIKKPAISMELITSENHQLDVSYNMPLTNILLEQNTSLIEQSKEMCSYLMKQNQQLLEENKQLKQHTTPVTTNVTNHFEKMENTTNIENKTFNINVFLNEECKDAVTLAEFVNSLIIEDADLFCAKEHGLVEAISNIFERGLQNCDIKTRPLHCTDSKRETLHIKEQNGWVKESGQESKRIKSAINHISNKKIHKLKEYMETRPEFENVCSPKYEECLKMMRGVMGADEEQSKTQKRVIHNIARSVYIKSNGTAK